MEVLSKHIIPHFLEHWSQTWWSTMICLRTEAHKTTDSKGLVWTSPRGPLLSSSRNPVPTLYGQSLAVRHPKWLALTSLTAFWIVPGLPDTLLLSALSPPLGRLPCGSLFWGTSILTLIKFTVLSLLFPLVLMRWKPENIAHSARIAKLPFRR